MTRRCGRRSRRCGRAWPGLWAPAREDRLEALDGHRLGDIVIHADRQTFLGITLEGIDGPWPVAASGSRVPSRLHGRRAFPACGVSATPMHATVHSCIILAMG
jgi:hypothetical protein